MKNIIGYSSSTIALAILNFLSLMILTRIFAPEDYGMANLIISYSVIVSTVISMSVDQAIMHYYYEYSLKNVILNSVKYALVIILLLLLIGMLFTSLSITNILLILGYSISLVSNKVYISLFRMEQTPKNHFIQSFGIKFLELMLILLFVYFFNKEYYIITIGFIISVIFMTCIQFTKIKIIIKKSDENYYGVKFKEQILFSLPLMVSIGVTAITQNIDKILLSSFVSSEELGVYYAAFKIVGIITIAYTIISLIWTPVAIRRGDKVKGNTLKEFITYSVSFFQYISLIIFMSFILFKNLFLYILGPAYIEALSLLNLLIGVPLFLIISEGFSTFITISRKTSHHLKISILILLINIFSTFLLAYFFGMIGAAIAILFTHIFLYYFRMISYHIISKDNKIDIERETVNIFLIALLLFSYFTDLYFIIITLIISIIVVMTIKNKNKYIELIKLFLKQ